MIIFRYLTREVVSHMLAIVLVLLLIFMINLFAGYMDSLSNGELTLLSLLKIISMQVPLLLGYLLPLALFLSILIVYARLYLNNEMVVLQASSFSRLRLYGYTLLYSSVILLLVAVLMLYVEPMVQKSRLQLKAEAYAQATLSKITPKRFVSLGGLNGYFYAQSEDNSAQRLTHVLWARPLSKASKPDQKLKRQNWDIVSAKWADDDVLPGIIDHFLVFHDGVEYIGSPGQADFKVSRFQSYGIRLQSKAAVLQNPIKFASTPDLFVRQRLSNDARAELQWRFAIPISGLLLVFMAVYFAKLNPRRGGKFMQIFPAVLLYVLYADLMFVARDKIEAGTPLGNAAGMWWVHGLFFILVMLLLAIDFKFIYKIRVFSKKLFNIDVWRGEK